jgi:RNA polymerase sigma-70 factor (ECF subfamily)
MRPKLASVRVEPERERVSAPGSEPPFGMLSFDAVYEEYFDFVWRALRMLGVGKDALEDAAQDTFSVVARQLGEFAGRSSLKTWLFAIAQRVAANHRRSTGRKQAPLEPLVGDEGATEPMQEIDAQAQEAASLINRYCESLEPGRRAVFVLCLIEEIPGPEVAQALGVPVNTVYSRIRTLRQGLVQFLESKEVTLG